MYVIKLYIGTCFNDVIFAINRYNIKCIIEKIFYSNIKKKEK